MCVCLLPIYYLIHLFFFKQKEDIDSSIAGLIIDCYKNVKGAYEADRTLKRQISIHDEEKSDLSYCEVSKKKKTRGMGGGESRVRVRVGKKKKMIIQKKWIVKISITKKNVLLMRGWSPKLKELKETLR